MLLINLNLSELAALSDFDFFERVLAECDKQYLSESNSLPEDAEQAISIINQAMLCGEACAKRADAILQSLTYETNSQGEKFPKFTKDEEARLERIKAASLGRRAEQHALDSRHVATVSNSNPAFALVTDLQARDLLTNNAYSRSLKFTRDAQAAPGRFYFHYLSVWATYPQQSYGFYKDLITQVITDIDDSNLLSALLRKIMTNPHEACAFALMVNGADPAQVDPITKKNAIELAQANGHHPIAKLMQDHCRVVGPTTFEDLQMRAQTIRTTFLSENPPESFLIFSFFRALDASSLSAEQVRQLLFVSSNQQVNLAITLASKRDESNPIQKILQSLHRALERGMSADSIATDLGIRTASADSFGLNVVAKPDNERILAFLVLLEALLEKGAKPATVAELLLHAAPQKNRVALGIVFFCDEACLKAYVFLVRKLKAAGFEHAARDLLNEQVAPGRLTLGDCLIARFSDPASLRNFYPAVIENPIRFQLTDPALLYSFIDVVGTSVTANQLDVIRKHSSALFTYIITLPIAERTPALHAIRDRNCVLGKIFESSDMRLINARIDHALGNGKETLKSDSYWDQPESIRPDISEKIRANWTRFSDAMRSFLIRLEKQSSNSEQLKALRIEPSAQWLETLTEDVFNIPVRLPGTTTVFDLATVLEIPVIGGRRVDPLAKSSFSLSEIVPADEVQEEIERAINAKKAQQTATSCATNPARFWSTPTATPGDDPRMSLHEIRNSSRGAFYLGEVKDLPHVHYLQRCLDASKKMTPEFRLMLISDELRRLEQINMRAEREVAQSGTELSPQELADMEIAKAQYDEYLKEMLPTHQSAIRQFELIHSRQQIDGMTDQEKNTHTRGAYQFVLFQSGFAQLSAKSSFQHCMNVRGNTCKRLRERMLELIAAELSAITDNNARSLLLRKLVMMNPHHDVVAALINAGANPWQVAEASGMSAIDRAMSEGHFALAKYMSDLARAKAGIPAAPQIPEHVKVETSDQSPTPTSPR